MSDRIPDSLFAAGPSTPPRPALCVGCWLLAVSLLAPPLPADEEARPQGEQLASPDETPPTSDADEVLRRQNTAAAGVLMLLGIAAIGLLVIAGALIWGAKTRRLVRKPELGGIGQDDLWYLRQGTAEEELELPSMHDASQPIRGEEESTTNTDDTRS